MVRSKVSRSRGVRSAVLLIIVVLVILSLVFLNRAVISGNAIYDFEENRVGTAKSMTIEQLEKGVLFTTEYQIFTWSNEFEEAVPIRIALNSLDQIISVESVGFDFGSNWAGPAYGNGRDLKNENNYRYGKLLTELKPGRRYKIRLKYAPQVLQYNHVE